MFDLSNGEKKLSGVSEGVLSPMLKKVAPKLRKSSSKFSPTLKAKFKIFTTSTKSFVSLPNAALIEVS